VSGMSRVVFSIYYESVGVMFFSVLFGDRVLWPP